MIRSPKTWRGMRATAGALVQDVGAILDRFEAPHGLRRPLNVVREELRDRWRRVLGGVGRASGLGRRASPLFAPDAQLLTATDDCWMIRVALPAIDAADVDVQLEGNLLFISGRWRDERRQRGRSGARLSRSLGSFTRIIELPRAIESSRIVAEFDRGLLEVQVPKGRPDADRVVIDVPRRHRRTVVESRMPGARAARVA